MRIELTEVLACPRCLPEEQGMVAVVDRSAEGRLLEGYLGCPRCEARAPVRGGHVDLGAVGSAGATARPREEAAAGPEGSGAGERAVRIAALLGLTGEGGGVVLLDERLAAWAPRVAALASGVEVLVLEVAGPGDEDAEAGRSASAGEATRSAAEGARAAVPDAAGGTGGGSAGERVTRLRGLSTRSLPIRSGRLRGLALEGGDPERVAEAERVLGPSGRLVVLRPEAGVPAAVEATSLRTLAAEPEALVAHVAAPGDDV